MDAGIPTKASVSRVYNHLGRAVKEKIFFKK